MTARDYSKCLSPLPHPGEHLREDFLPDYGLTAGSLAKAMGLRDRTRIERLVREAQPVTPDTALRLGKVFGTTADFWMNLQVQHDLSAAAIKSRRALKVIKPLAAWRDHDRGIRKESVRMAKQKPHPEPVEG